ncbi:hypothetical protein C9I98_25130 [Photobacterium sanctipauli]|uniref:DUF2780 domain-containing protein n=1 Tax=Photobacterium sanctipauli TaxID=1342794 RepID=A0A2T3NA41_9GAMM|nr:DUF2780 domain-containing protein [Photobacterium sanctipauli]PSW10490.1 hypothetical protein C9I98_25130 [Photobacterium sanctipauli]
MAHPAHWYQRILLAATVIGTLTAPISSSAFSLSDLFGGGDEEAAQTAEAANPLTSLLSSQLGITPEQATGGAGALLSIASSQLGGDQASELAKIIPGADALADSLPPGMGALLGNMDTINQVFSALGMDPSMVSQFIPVVMQFLGDQGASAGLMESLGNIWNPAKS